MDLSFNSHFGPIRQYARIAVDWFDIIKPLRGHVTDRAPADEQIGCAT
jgi:hypothetical protein